VVVLVLTHQSLTRHHVFQILFILTVLEFRYITCARPLPYSQLPNPPTYQSLHLPTIQPPVSANTISPSHKSSTSQANLQYIMSSQPVNQGQCVSSLCPSSGSSTSGSSTAAAGTDSDSTAIGTDTSGSNGPGTDPWASEAGSVSGSGSGSVSN
jgi:hypothetical protein